MDDLSQLVRGTLSHHHDHDHDDDRSDQMAAGYCGGGGVKKTHSPASSISGDENPRDQGKNIRLSHSKRVSHSKTTTVITHSPFADGYQWRKYGQKVIRNVNFPRSYYRCTYAGCRAKLLVQQITDSGSLPMYELTRSNEHTCNAVVVNPPPSSAFRHSRSPATPMRESNIITFDSDRSVPSSSFARGANIEQVHNFDYFCSVQQMQNRSSEMLSPGSSSDTTSSSSSLLHLSIPAAPSHQAPDIENNSDHSNFFGPPLSPAGKFYGPDASAYL